MQKTTVSLVDDLDGSEAAETVRFGLDNKLYEIDLSTDNASELRLVLGEYVNAARKVTNGHKPTPSQTAAGRDRNQAIRAWARERYEGISDRGRIPAQVIEAYDAAHPTN